MSRLLTYQQLLTLIACVNKVKPRYEDHYAAVAEEFCRETSLQWSATETYEKFWLAFTGQLAENCLHFFVQVGNLNVIASFSFGFGKGQDCEQCAGCDQEDAARPVQECHGPV